MQTISIILHINYEWVITAWVACSGTLERKADRLDGHCRRPCLGEVNVKNDRGEWETALVRRPRLVICFFRKSSPTSFSWLPVYMRVMLP